MFRERVIGFFSIFGSAATLFCCALPALLSVVAGGAAIGTFVSAFPWVIPLSRYKEWLFLAVGALLVVNGILLFRPRGRIACALTGGKGCEVAGGFAKGVLGLAILLYFTGAFVAYALVPILQLLGF